jgi:hypothetical protein
MKKNYSVKLLVMSVSLFAIEGSAQDSAKMWKQKFLVKTKPSLITFNENL